MYRILLAALLIGLLPAAWAQSPGNGMSVDHPWSRASSSATGVVYLTLANGSAADDRLVTAATPVADKAEIHESYNDNGVMKMRPIAGVAIKAGGKAVLKPGGLHIMLFGLKQPLAQGQSFPLTLTFEKAGKLEVTVAVEKAGSMGGMKGMSM
jgi:periplasmic copper chaperone A